MKPKRNEVFLKTKEQVHLFTETAQELFPPPSPWGTFFMQAVLSGLREGELLRLQWGDLDLEGKLPCLSVQRAWDREEGFVIPKSRAAFRNIPILPDVRRSLLAWKIASLDSSKCVRVFPFMGGSYHRALRHILKANPNLPKISLHALRHTFASLFANRGVPPKVLQGWTGHAKIDMTLNYYAKKMDDDTRIVEERLAGIGGV